MTIDLAGFLSDPGLRRSEILRSLCLVKRASYRIQLRPKAVFIYNLLLFVFLRLL